MKYAAALLVLAPTPLAAQAIAPGNWDLKSTAIDLTIPGAPGFIVRMMKGKSRTEHKCVAPDQARGGIAALFVPNPKAQCRIESSRIADGRIDHVMLCPQKKGAPLRVVRTGTYDQSGFAARMTMSGQTPKGPLSIVASQTAAHTGGTCKK